MRTGFIFDLYFKTIDVNIDGEYVLIKDYLPTKFEASGAKCSWVFRCISRGRPIWPFDLDIWPTDLNINKDHLIKDYLSTKFLEFSVAPVVGDRYDLLTLTFGFLI